MKVQGFILPEPGIQTRPPAEAVSELLAARARPLSLPALRAPQGWDVPLSRGPGSPGVDVQEVLWV